MRRVALALLLALCLSPRLAAAQTLVADLSSHLIAITTGFTGAEVVLFGAIDQPGDVVVVVNGPDSQEDVRRKQRVGGIWMNGEAVTFTHVPQFYALASSRPLEGLLRPSVALRHEIGLDYLRLQTAAVLDLDDLAEYRAALIRGKQRLNLYPTEVGRVTFLGQRLFRTTLSMPAAVPTGLYSINVYLIRNADVISAQTTPLTVSKIGFSADVYDFAQQHGLAYGVIGVSLAIAAGWAAGSLFRKS